MALYLFQQLDVLQALRALRLSLALPAVHLLSQLLRDRSNALLVADLLCLVVFCL
jgi:hypothetical protein